MEEVNSFLHFTFGKFDQGCREKSPRRMPFALCSLLFAATCMIASVRLYALDFMSSTRCAHKIESVSGVRNKEEKKLSFKLKKALGMK